MPRATLIDEDGLTKLARKAGIEREQLDAFRSDMSYACKAYRKKIDPDAKDQPRSQAAELDKLLSDPAALAAQFQKVLTAVRAEQAAAAVKIDAAMEKLIATKASADAEHAKRLRELQLREAAADVREREAAEMRERAELAMRDVENARADLGNRVRGLAAA